MHNALSDKRVDLLLAQLGPEYRVLRRLRIEQGYTGRGTRDAPFIGVAIDVETTGVDPERDSIIELALRRFRWDHDGIIVAIDKPYSWLEDPGELLSDEITEITGLTDADLAGKGIEEEDAVRLLRSADLCLAHNALFDRKFVEKRLPEAAGLAWACTMSEIDWRERGFDSGRTLGWLLSQAGWFHEGHRAVADVDAVIALLSQTFDGRTALDVMLERTMAPSWIVSARGAAFEVKDLLRVRGYRWAADKKVWWREVPDIDRLKEEFWLAGHIYSPEARPKALGADWCRVTRFERYA